MLLGPRRKLYTYLAVTVLYALVIAWWIVFFSRQDEILLGRMRRLGAELSAAQARALTDATGDSMRMFAFEGAFLGLLLAASVVLVLRSLHREIALQSAQKNMLSAFTHELKSPIASAKLYLESLLGGRVEQDKRERYLTHAREDLERLHRLLDEMLLTARMQSVSPRLVLEEHDLASLVERGVHNVQSDPAVAKLAIQLDLRGPLPVRADPRSIETVLRNLLSNALKYGGASEKIDVSAGRMGRDAFLKVRDRGPGLRGQDPKQLFEPFVRGGEKLVSDQPGSGLGLYFVAELAKAHRGSVSAREAPAESGGGLEVEVRLPLLDGAQGHRGVERA